MKWIASFFVVVGMLSAQDASSVQTLVTPLGIPCDPGQPNPFGDSFPIVCPPVDQQGAMVFVNGNGATPVAYKVTVNYTAADGSTQTSVQPMTRNTHSDW